MATWITTVRRFEIFRNGGIKRIISLRCQFGTSSLIWISFSAPLLEVLHSLLFFTSSEQKA
jgi:hypothetical protein